MSEQQNQNGHIHRLSSISNNVPYTELDTLVNPTYTELSPLILEREQSRTRRYREILPLNPTRIKCPQCAEIVFSDVKYKFGTLSILIGIIVFILVVLIFSIFMSYASYENSIHCEFLALILMIIAGCSLLFLPVPFLINCIKDVAHFCPSCQFLIGIRKRLNVNLEKIRQLFNFSK